MTLARAVLLTFAAVFAAIGVGFLWMPTSWARAIEVVVSTPMGRTDVRATYGGFMLAFGTFLALGAVLPELTRPALLACGLALAGFAGGRVIGLAVEGTLSGLMITFLIVEMVGAVLSFYAYARLAAPASY